MSKNILNKIDLESTISVGLDVCKTKIDICFLRWNNKDIFLQIQNSKKWIIDFIEFLKEHNFNTEIPLIIESTWDFDTLACIMLSEAKLNIKEINPIITKNYTKHTTRWTKTDKTDAKALANIWLINKDELFTFSKSKIFIESSKKIALISTLEKQIQSLKRTLKSYNEVLYNLEIGTSQTVKNIEITIIELTVNIKSLQEELEDESIWENNDKKVELINSIPWVSKYMAQVFYISFAHKDFESKKSMYAFVWYEPRLKNSWDFSWKARISKRWNAYVRKKLFQAGFMSIRHCKLFKDIYERLKLEWKHHFICINAVVKKIIHIVYSLLKNNTVFNSNFGSF